jgi:hypothetical protein
MPLARRGAGVSADAGEIIMNAAHASAPAEKPLVRIFSSQPGIVFRSQAARAHGSAAKLSPNKRACA